jgi:hypothetical protein
MPMFSRRISQLEVRWIFMDSINTVNGILRKYGERYRAELPFLSVHEKKIMRALELCRTEALGGRIEVCDKCGHTVRLYNSCRNRHCPQCQFMKKEKWIASKKNEIFPFQYFHIVFTLPDKLNPIVFRNKKLLYDNLFNKVKETLLSISDEKKYFGAKIGFFSILHTWGQKLNMHPHLHCVVPGGGYSEKERRWKSCRENYLLPVEVVKKRFRSLFLLELKAMYKRGDLFLSNSEYQNADAFYQLIDELFSMEWVVYIKESFKNSDSVIEYLGRYTHRIAISNYRILKVEDDKVSFTYKDYKENNAKKTMTLSALDFIRRFMTHVLPLRYVRIRYYGIMSNRNKKNNLENCYEFFNLEHRIKDLPGAWDDIYMEITGIDIHICTVCGEGQMIVKGGIEKTFTDRLLLKQPEFKSDRHSISLLQPRYICI